MINIIPTEFLREAIIKAREKYDKREAKRERLKVEVLRKKIRKENSKI